MGPKNTIELIARGLMIDSGRVLMCRNVEREYCYLPGGHVEFAERASDALVRELKEETGLDSSVGRMLLTTEQCFYGGKRIHHEINTVFHVEQLGPSQAPPKEVPSTEDAIDFVWIEFAHLPEVDVRPTEIKAWLISGGATDHSKGHWVSGFEHPAANH